MDARSLSAQRRVLFILVSAIVKTTSGFWNVRLWCFICWFIYCSCDLVRNVLVNQKGKGSTEESQRVKDMKRRGQKEHSNQGDEQNKFIYYNKTDIDTLKIVVCVCVCVWLTQLNYKKVNDGNILLSWITYLNVFLFVIRNSQFLWDWKKSHSQCILKKWMSARLIHFFFCFSLLLMNKKNVTLKREREEFV